MLDALIMAHDVETDAVLNDIELSHNAKVIFLAGHETSSAGLTYALYLLSRHPDAQKKAQEEADAFFKGSFRFDFLAGWSVLTHSLLSNRWRTRKL